MENDDAIVREKIVESPDAELFGIFEFVGLPGTGKTTLSSHLRERCVPVVITKNVLVEARGGRFFLHSQSIVRFLRVFIVMLKCGHCGLLPRALGQKRWRKLYYVALLRQLYADAEKNGPQGTAVLFDQGIVQEIAFVFMDDFEAMEIYAPAILAHVVGRLPLTVVWIQNGQANLIERVQKRTVGKAFFDIWETAELRELLERYDMSFRRLIAIYASLGYEVRLLSGEALDDCIRYNGKRSLQEEFRQLKIFRESM